MNAQVKDSLGVAGRGLARRQERTTATGRRWQGRAGVTGRRWQGRTSATGRRWPTRPRGLVPVHGGTLAPPRFRQRAAMP